MSLITIYKNGRSVSVDNSPNGLEIMKKAGWTDVQPTKQEKPVDPVKWTTPAKRGRKKKGESD